MFAGTAGGAPASSSQASRSPAVASRSTTPSPTLSSGNRPGAAPSLKSCVLPATGTYALFIDPQGAATGGITTTIYVPPDAGAAATVGGAGARVTTTAPGRTRVTFAGTASISPSS